MNLVHRQHSVPSLGAALALLGAMCACAAGPRTANLGPEAARALAAVEQVKVVMDNPELRAGAAVRIAHGTGPALAPADARGVPELRLRVSCEATFDQYKPLPPINAPASGVDSDKMDNWHPSSTGTAPGCEGEAEVVAGGRVVWRDSSRSDVVSGFEGRALCDMLVDRFMEAWRKARAGAATAAPPAR